MNSSLLVPAFVGLSLATVFGVFFGESIFSGTSQSDLESNVAKVENVDVKASPETETVVATTDNRSSEGSDFTWGMDSKSDDLRDAPAATPAMSEITDVKRTVVDEVAPDELVSAPKDQTTVAKATSAAKDAQVGSDLDSFFNRSSADTQTVSKPAQKDNAFGMLSDDVPPKKQKTDYSMAPSDFGSSAKSSQMTDSLDSQVATTTPETSFGDDLDLDSFDAGKQSSTRSKTNQNEKKPNNFATSKTGSFDTAPKSVVADSSLKSVQPSMDMQGSRDSSSVIAGDFEPVAQAGSSKATTMTRKMKITNPKETTLAVTLSVDGKQITLKPDQSYVINKSDGDVEVTFSRGGSFGFKTQKLTKGHYRFSVSRESGWKLNN